MLALRRVYLNPGAGNRRTGISSSPWASQEGQDFLSNNVVADIDFATLHIWADNWLGYADFSTCILCDDNFDYTYGACACTIRREAHSPRRAQNRVDDTCPRSCCLDTSLIGRTGRHLSAVVLEGVSLARHSGTQDLGLAHFISVTARLASFSLQASPRSSAGLSSLLTSEEPLKLGHLEADVITHLIFF